MGKEIERPKQPKPPELAQLMTQPSLTRALHPRVVELAQQRPTPRPPKSRCGRRRFLPNADRWAPLIIPTPALPLLFQKQSTNDQGESHGPPYAQSSTLWSLCANTWMCATSTIRDARAHL